MLRFDESNRLDFIQMQELCEQEVEKEFLDKVIKGSVTLADGEDLQYMEKFLLESGSISDPGSRSGKNNFGKQVL